MTVRQGGAKLAGLLGLGVRGRLVVVGVQQVRAAAQRGKLHYALVATDASRHSVDKVVPLLEARRIPFAAAGSAIELGEAVGRQSTAVVGIVDRELARGVRDTIAAATSEDSAGGRVEQASRS